MRLKAAWFGKLETRKHWSEQYAQWLNLENQKPETSPVYWQQQTEMLMLRNEKAMLESQYAHWRRLAAFYEEALREQQDLIENTEREKAALERE